MKNVIIVLLIAAIGGGAYYFFTKQKKQSPTQLTSRELIVGQWKLDSLQFDFKENSTVFQSVNAKTIDTASYRFENEKTLMLKSKHDSIQKVWNIIKLDSLNLAVQDKDSNTLTFQKLQP